MSSSTMFGVIISITHCTLQSIIIEMMVFHLHPGDLFM